MHINEKFAKLAESLYIADRKARESVELRAQLQKKQAQKEKEKKEETLRQLAQQVREERAGLRPSGSGAGGAAREDDEDAAERDNLRQERHRDRQRERNLARAAPGGDKKYHVSCFLCVLVATILPFVNIKIEIGAPKGTRY